MKSSSVFWGSLILTIGVLLLLYNLDLFAISPGNIFDYWPLLIIIWGITFFKLPKFVKLSLSMLSGFFLGFILVSLLNLNVSEKIHFNINKKFGQKSVVIRDNLDSTNTNYFEVDYHSSFENAEFKMDASSGVFDFRELTDKLLLVETNRKNCELTTDIIDSTKIFAEFEADDYDRDEIESFVYRVKMHPSPLWDINLDIASPRIDMDLSAFRIRNLSIDGGAADIDLKLGDFYNDTFVDMDLGVSNIRILVPESSGIKIRSSSAISNINYSDLNEIYEINNNQYQTKNWESADKRITINIDSGISNINIESYK
jgi:hypothetical protein